MFSSSVLHECREKRHQIWKKQDHSQNKLEHLCEPLIDLVSVHDYTLLDARRDSAQIFRAEFSFSGKTRKTFLV